MSTINEALRELNEIKSKKAKGDYYLITFDIPHNIINLDIKGKSPEELLEKVKERYQQDYPDSEFRLEDGSTEIGIYGTPSYSRLGIIVRGNI